MESSLVTKLFAEYGFGVAMSIVMVIILIFLLKWVLKQQEVREQRQETREERAYEHERNLLGIIESYREVINNLIAEIKNFRSEVDKAHELQKQDHDVLSTAINKIER
jgi:uncharacterized protein YlxW (UPF0749 family)